VGREETEVTPLPPASTPVVTPEAPPVVLEPTPVVLEPTPVVLEPAPNPEPVPEPAPAPPVVVSAPETRAATAVKKPRRRATIEVHVRPWGKVSVDGKEKGNTPLLRQFTASAGKHTIVVEHPELGKRKQTVVLKAGERRVLRFDLR
jgi:hypothetical protein